MVRAIGIVLGLVLAFNDQVMPGLVVVFVAFAVAGKTTKSKKPSQAAAAQQFEAAMQRRQVRALEPRGGRLTVEHEDTTSGNQIVPGPRTRGRPFTGLLENGANPAESLEFDGGAGPSPTPHQGEQVAAATPVRQESEMSSSNRADGGTEEPMGADSVRHPNNPRLPDISEVEAPRSRDTDPYDATPRIDDAPVREMARTNEELLARSQESMNQMRSRIEAEAQQARVHAAEALAATVRAAGLTASAVDGSKIRQTADSLPPLSGSGAAREMPWDKPMELAGVGTADHAGSVADRLARELGRHSGTEVFRNVRLTDFGTKAPLVVARGDRAVIVDVVDLPGEGLSWVVERGRRILAGGATRSEQPDRIAETITDWNHDNPDADFASVITLAQGTLGDVAGESLPAVNLLDPADVVGTITDWLAEAGGDQAVKEKLHAYLQSRANRF